MIIKTVTIAGVGRVGRPVAEALRDAGFAVSILSRSGAGLQFSGVIVHTVDYADMESLTLTLTGQDAVVCTFGVSGILVQKNLIDAAVAAGVKYFIPAEYTIDTTHPLAKEIPLYHSVLEIQAYLGNRIRWTVIHVGAMLEYLFDTPFLLDFEAHHAVLWDGGEGTLNVSDASIVSEAIVGVLKNINRAGQVVRVRGDVISQDQALKIAQNYATWTCEERDTKTEIERCKELLRSGSSDLAVMLSMWAALTFATDNTYGVYEELDNQWLDIKPFEKDRVTKAIEARILRDSETMSSGTMESLSTIMN